MRFGHSIRDAHGLKRWLEPWAHAPDSHDRLVCLPAAFLPGNRSMLTSLFVFLIAAMPCLPPTGRSSAGRLAMGITPAPSSRPSGARTKTSRGRRRFRARAGRRRLCPKGKVYLTTAVAAGEGDQSLRAICVNAESGKIEWDKQVFLAPKAQASMHASARTATPVRRRRPMAIGSTSTSATWAPPPST